MTLAERYATAVTDHSKLVIAVVLVLTLVVGAGAGNVDGGLTIAGFSSDSPEAVALDDIERNFSVSGENTTTAQVVVRGDNVLSRQALLETLRLQKEIRQDESINATLRGNQPTIGVGNIVATAAYYESHGGGGPPPSLDEQLDQLESMSAAEVESTVARVLDPEADIRGDPYALLSTDYEPGATTAPARIVLVYQDTSGAPADDLPAAVSEAQLELQDLAAAEISSMDHFVFGPAIVDEQSGQATGESFALISPVALLLILGVLGFAYRDAIDVLLGLFGVALVLVWMAGFLGWAGIGITQILIAVPFLLIGLSIDYALHVVMRYREAAVDGDDEPRVAMRRGLASVVVAIGAATFTTAVGFLSNTVSSITSIREFGLVSGFGIGAAFVVFGLLFPALKIEVDGLRERIGWAPDRSPFGRGGSVGRLLGVGATLARRAPSIVIVVAIVLAAGGGVAATQIDTTLDQSAFLPEDSPEWMELLPAAIQPSDYDLKENAAYLAENFVQSRRSGRAEFLIRGPVTDPETLDTIAAARDALRETESAAVRADGGLQITDPLSTVNAVAAENETVAAMVEDADTDGDGVPDENLAAIYDAVYDADPSAAAATIHREGGEYQSLRVSVALTGTTNTRVITEEMRAVAAGMEQGSRLDVVATGTPITTELVQQSLLRTLVEGFLITFGIILAFLTLIFRVRYHSATLGAVVLFPVVLAQAWLFGTIFLAGLAFTTETAIIAAIGIGIGVDYAIHIGERFVEERDGGQEPIAALRRTVRGTGGALLASAATTAAGFGVLMLALVPSLQRFGFITAVAITYAFLASVLVLPSLLVLWSKVVDGVEQRAEATA